MPFNKQKNSLLLFIPFIILVLSCSNEEDVSNKLREANNYSKAGKYVSALKIINAVLKSNPGDINALFDRSFIYSIQGNYKLSNNDLNKIILQDDKNQLAYFNRSLNFYYLDQLALSERDIKKAISLKGNNLVWTEESPEENNFVVTMEELRYQRGLIYYDTKRWDLALSDFSFCISSSYLVEESSLYGGLISMEKQNIKEACNYFFDARNMGSYEADSLFRLYGCSEDEIKEARKIDTIVRYELVD